MSLALLRRRPKYVPPWELKPWPGESTEHLLHRQDEQYFQEQVLDNVQWWERFDYRCGFRGAKVLDLGCGHGALSLSIAEAGADEVLGLDLDARRICFANEVLNERYPTLRNKVSFAVEDIVKLTKPGYFDYVISKDSFEHIEGLNTVIAAVEHLLKPGGKIIVGFSPLYYSPFGDHGRLQLPRGLWLHALLPEQATLGWLSFRSGKKFHVTSDIGLNKLTPRQFHSLFSQSTWKPITVRYNRGSRRLLPLMSRLRRISWLERYFTVSIYAVFETASA
jgi:SAM-dependent methyltransferase